MNNLQKAIDFSTKKHEGQLRKYTNEPYITHPIAVMELVNSVGIFNEHMLCACILHDTVEDTNTTVQEIEENFGIIVSRLVEQLTDVYTSEKFPNIRRRERKLLECYRLLNVSGDAKSIKLADLIHNTSSIVENDANFAKVYLKEKRAMLQVLEGGNSALMEMARKTLLDAEKYLKELK
jgi:(p)ppGpp synthase/HD superfamily hydrolase